MVLVKSGSTNATNIVINGACVEISTEKTWKVSCELEPQASYLIKSLFTVI